MKPRQQPAILSLMRTTIITVTLLISIFALATAFTYDWYQTYAIKITETEKLAGLLALSASSPDKVDLVSEQVGYLLNEDATLQSIIFYSTEYPIEQARTENISLYHALFTKTISINEPVTSRSIIYSADTSNSASSLPQTDFQQTDFQQTNSSLEKNALLGYISITIDVAALRLNWYETYKFIWLMSLLLTPLSMYLILRLLTHPVKQVVKLAEVSDQVVNDETLTQLPIIKEKKELSEISRIKQAMIVLFERLNNLQKEHSSLKEYEQQLNSRGVTLDVQRNNFQSMITHELKTSLNAVFGGLQLLSNHYLSDEQQDALAIIRKGSQHLDFTLEQIIQLNRIEKGQMGLNDGELNPLQLLSSVVAEFEPLAKQKGLILTTQISHVDYLLEGDSNKIRMVLNALLDNAIKFTKKGKVTVASHLNHFDKTTRWKISVIDTGIGIEARYLEDIFTPFFQIDPSIDREFEGVGVGLSLAKQIANLLGATLEVDSVLNQGSRFDFIIQLNNWSNNKDRHLLKGLKSLSYHQNQAATLPLLLKNYDLNSEFVQHSKQVIDRLADSTYDLLLICEDILPSKAANLAQQVRQAETTTRILIVYVFDVQERNEIVEDDLKAAGVDYFLPTTISPVEVAKTLRQWLLD